MNGPLTWKKKQIWSIFLDKIFGIWIFGLKTTKRGFPKINQITSANTLLLRWVVLRKYYVINRAGHAKILCLLTKWFGWVKKWTIMCLRNIWIVPRGHIVWLYTRAVGSSEKQGGDTLSSEKLGGGIMKLIMKIAFLRVKLLKSTKNRGAGRSPAP